MEKLPSLAQLWLIPDALVPLLYSSYAAAADTLFEMLLPILESKQGISFRQANNWPPSRLCRLTHSDLEQVARLFES